MPCLQDYNLVPGGEHTAQAFQGLTFGGNDSGIGIGLGMLQQQAQAAQNQGFQPQVCPPSLQGSHCLMMLLLGCISEGSAPPRTLCLGRLQRSIEHCCQLNQALRRSETPSGDLCAGSRPVVLHQRLWSQGSVASPA